MGVVAHHHHASTLRRLQRSGMLTREQLLKMFAACLNEGKQVELLLLHSLLIQSSGCHHLHLSKVLASGLAAAAASVTQLLCVPCQIGQQHC